MSTINSLHNLASTDFSDKDDLRTAIRRSLIGIDNYSDFIDLDFKEFMEKFEKELPRNISEEEIKENIREVRLLFKKFILTYIKR